MRPAVRTAFVAFTEPLEGCVPWLYLDVKGLVTIAIGNLVDPQHMAASLPLVRPDGTPATPEEIAGAWQAVKNRPELAQKGHRAAAQYTTLRLTPEGIDKVVLGKLAEMETYLIRRFHAFEDWPADAQLATLSMAWACGPAFNFPRLSASLQAQDWAGAAQHCHMNEAGNPGLKPRNAKNKQLYRNAAFVVSNGLDPDVLYFPRDLAGEPDTVPDVECHPAGDQPIIRPRVPLGRPRLDE